MRPFFLGYNTNGLAHHAFPDACRLIADEGFEGVAVTLDHDLLRRNADGGLEFRTSPAEIAKIVRHCGLRCVVETGARFLLDPAKKHEPTFFDPDAARRKMRQAYYFRAVELAAETDATCVSLWTGQNSPSEEGNYEMFRGSLIPVMEYARSLGVKIALEPEPGMLVGTTREYDELLAVMPEADDLWLTLDVGHMICSGEPIYETIRKYRHRLVNVHLDDGRRGEHEHRKLGFGEINFAAVFEALTEIGFAGGACVELSRHSREAPEAVRESREFLLKI